MKNILKLTALSVTAAVSLFGCTYNEIDSQYGELGIIFDTEEVVLNAGETFEIPFTVTGSEGAALDFEPSSDNSEADLRDWARLTTTTPRCHQADRPKSIPTDQEAQVFLKVSDSHQRKLTRFVDVTLVGNGGSDDSGDGGDGKSDGQYGDLGIFFDVASPSVSPGQTLGIPFTVTGSEGATLSLEPSVDKSGYDCALGKVDYVNYQGIINLTAPEVITEATEVKVSSR